MARQRKRAPDVAAYAGKWVAFSRNRVIAAGTSLSGVLQKAEAKRPRVRPSVFLVPRDDEGPYVLRSLHARC